MDVDERNQLINKLSRRVVDLQNVNESTVDRTGEYRFSESKVTLQLIGQLFKRIHTQQLTDLPNTQLRIIESQANFISDAIHEMQTFDPTKHTDPNTHYQSLVERLDTLHSNAYSKLSSTISFIAAGHLSETRFLQMISSNFSEIQQFLNTRLQAIEDVGSGEMKRIKSLLAEMEKQSTQATEIVESIQIAAAEAGVATQSEFFSIEANDCRKASRVWLVATALSILALVYIAVLLLVRTDLHPALQPKDLYSTIQLSVTKVLIYATLTTFILFSIRNYNSSRHNMTVNQHRHNALRTYKALVEATDQPDTRSIILNHAAACIFADQPTGYSKHDVTDAKIPPLVSMAPATIRATSESA